jgi:tetratricopeptide (TPR) repeat protein
VIPEICQKTDVKGQLYDSVFAGLRCSRVKPLGTITMCFPYVDDDIRATLQSVMDEAENYADFAERLCKKICDEAASPLMEFFAFFFAWYILESRLLERLEDAGKVPDLAKPLQMVFRSYHGGEAVDWFDMKESLIRALDAAPNDWIASLVYLGWRWWADILYPETDVDVQLVEVIEKSIGKSDDLEYFEAHLSGQEAARLHREGSFKQANRTITKAIAVARKFDDLVEVANLMSIKANYIKHSNLGKAIDLLLTTRNLCDQLGYRFGFGSVQGELAHIMGLRGELDAAIDYQLEKVGLFEEIGLQTGRLNTIIALYFNLMGNGRSALRYAKSALELFDTPDQVTRWSPYPHAQMAWALINLGRTEEAKEEVEKAKSIVAKTGDTLQHTFSKIVEGIFDRSENNHETATQTFQEVLKAFEEHPIPLWENICLLNLVEIEIDRLSSESIDTNIDSSGPWMDRLEKYVQENDLPGITTRSILLKAKLRQKQGRYDDVRGLLKEVLKAAESPSMKYLNDLAISDFPDIFVT